MVCLATVRSSGHGDDAHRWYLAAPSHEGWVLSMGRVGDPRAGVTLQVRTTSTRDIAICHACGKKDW